MDTANDKSNSELQHLKMTPTLKPFITSLAPMKEPTISNSNVVILKADNTVDSLKNEESIEMLPVVTTKTITVGNSSSPTITINNLPPIDVPKATSEDLEDDSTTTNENSIVPALPSTSRQLYQEAAAAHGGNESTSLLQQEQAQLAQLQQQHQQQQQQMQRIRTASSTLDATVSRNPSTTGKHEKKIGHRRVADTGEVTYKRIESKQIMGSIQLGIQHSVGGLASKPKRDLLMNDFWEMETISFPSDGSQMTPAHHFSDFRFKVYAPIAFRYFRDLFGILPGDFLISMGYEPLRELSNPGASGSLFYLSDDDEFIIKTVQKKECEFLQKLLPGYYMNLSQNPRTLLPKFFGLWCFHYNSKNVRLVAMNNLLPSHVKMHEKYDLKGSTFRRKASKTERQKSSPTFKDLDFMERHPGGIFLESDNYKALISTIQRDCMVLESFQIMDYSLLVGIHNVDIAQKEKMEQDVNMRTRLERAKLERHDEIHEVDEPPDLEQSALLNVGAVGTQAAGTALNRTRSMNRQRLVAHSTAMESIAAEVDTMDEDEDVPAGGIPARGENNEKLILFVGIIDILQSYRLEKKLEHTFKSILYNGDTVSVCRPSFYAQRFKNFMSKTVFKNAPSFKTTPSKRKPSTATQRPPMRTPSHSLTPAARPNILSRSSTPPPPFDDISEEDVTANSTTITAGNTRTSTTSRRPSSQQQQTASSSRSRSRMSSTTEDYSDDDVASGSGIRSTRRPYSPRLSRTNVQVTTVGCLEDTTTNTDEQASNTIVLTTNPITSNTTKTATETKTEPSIEATTIPQTINHPDGIVVDANGKPGNKSPIYKSTLVLNDIGR